MTNYPLPTPDHTPAIFTDDQVRNLIEKNDNQVKAIQTLENTVTDLRKERNEVRARWERDMQHIGDKAAEFADDKGYCDEWDQLLSEINEGLDIEIPPRERTFEVTVTFKYDVEANNEENATEKAVDYFDNCVSFGDNSSFLCELE